jgi:hypothetical protein
VAYYLLVDGGISLASGRNFLFRRHFRTILFGLVCFPYGATRTQREDNIFSFITVSTARQLALLKPLKLLHIAWRRIE